MSDDVAKMIVALGVLTLLVFGLALLVALPVMWLWNGVMVDAIHAGEISFWQAFGLNILCGLLVRIKISTNKESK